MQRKDALIVAAFVPVAGPPGKPEELTMRLALEELQAAGGLPTSTGDRTIGVLMCESDPEMVDAAFKHVTETLKVPAIVAGFDAKGLPDYAQRAAERGIFVLNPGVTPETLKFKANLQQFVWSLLGTPNDVAMAYRPLLQRAEPYARRFKDAGPDADAAAESLRVAILKTDTSTENSIELVLREGSAISGSSGRDESKALFFNDASAAQNLAAGKLSIIPVASSEKKEPLNETAINSALLAQRPDVVIALTQDEVAKVIANLDQSDPTIRPVWLMGPRNARAVLDYFAKDGDAKRRRFLGVQYAGTAQPAQRDAWLTRMHHRYDSDKINESVYASYENYYDAIYWLAYGLVAAGDGAPVDGTAFKIGVRKLTGGSEEVNPGPEDKIGPALPAIALGRATYVGALGPPDIDLAFGVWNSVGGVYCYDRPSDGGPPAPRYDTLRYDRASGTLREPDGGVFSCIIGF